MKYPSTLAVIAAVLGTAILIPLPALASEILNVNITQQRFESPGSYVADFLGGDGTIGLGVDLDQQRRLALNTIHGAFDWAYWDPSGLGNDFDFGDGNAFSYHDGRQIQWGSKFSTPSTTGQEPPNGTITPANLDSLGARWNLDTGNEIAQSGQGRVRIQDSGRVGLRLDPTNEDLTNGHPAVPLDGQKFHLEMTLPDGQWLVSLFGEDRVGAPITLNFPGVPTENVGPIFPAADDEFALQIQIDNTSGGPQVLEFDWGDLNNDLTDMDIRFSAAVIQDRTAIPEPGTLVLALLGMAVVGRLRRR